MTQRVHEHPGFLVCRDLSVLRERVGAARIIMVDGTVPGWQPGPEDHHFDHHRPGGAAIQIDEIDVAEIDVIWACERPACLVTTVFDADACSAATWIQLGREVNDEALEKLRAIAHDCDHLGVREEHLHLAEFATKSVAALKVRANELIPRLELPSDIRSWTEEQRVAFGSAGFRMGTDLLSAAVRGEGPWPGEAGEADEHFRRIERDVRELRIHCRRIGDVLFFDQREVGRYVDPRVLVTWAREIGYEELSPVTLTGRLGPQGAGLAFTLGSLPLHPDLENLDFTRGVFEALTQAEREREPTWGAVRDERSGKWVVRGWGGRATVGGSAWGWASSLRPEEVVDTIRATVTLEKI